MELQCLLPWPWDAVLCSHGSAPAPWVAGGHPRGLGNDPLPRLHSGTQTKPRHRVKERDGPDCTKLTPALLLIHHLQKKRLIKDPSSQDNTSISCSIALWIKREAS